MRLTQQIMIDQAKVVWMIILLQVFQYNFPKTPAQPRKSVSFRFGNQCKTLIFEPIYRKNGEYSFSITEALDTTDHDWPSESSPDDYPTTGFSIKLPENSCSTKKECPLSVWSSCKSLRRERLWTDLSKKRHVMFSCHWNAWHNRLWLTKQKQSGWLS